MAYYLVKGSGPGPEERDFDFAKAFRATRVLLATAYFTQRAAVTGHGANVVPSIILPPSSVIGSSSTSIAYRRIDDIYIFD